MSKVFVLDSQKRPLAPCAPARCRQLLKKGEAALYLYYPFTIILKGKRVENTDIGQKPLRLKIDPGSKTTGIAIVNDESGEIEFASELEHRGVEIKRSLDSRRSIRRSRRSRKTRYRKARFKNRRRPKGWLAPSLMSRVYNIETWVGRLRKFCPIEAISVELVRFDTQKMENPEISSVEYQQGELTGYEVREYLLEKWGRKCAYCQKRGVPLEVEHIIPKSRGGTNRVSNLTISCRGCNKKKGKRTAEEFGFLKIEAEAKQPLRDVAFVNATRMEIYRRLQSLGVGVEVGSGGLTKFNRSKQSLPKTHWIDAASVGVSTPTLRLKGVKPLIIRARGHGNRQMSGTNQYGFPIRHRSREKKFYGFQSGDIVKAEVKGGKKMGVYVGRVLVRSSGSFDISLKARSSSEAGRVQGISWKSCQLLHHADGYSYSYGYNDKESVASSAHINVAASATQNL